MTLKQKNGHVLKQNNFVSCSYKSSPPHTGHTCFGAEFFFVDCWVTNLTYFLSSRNSSPSSSGPTPGAHCVWCTNYGQHRYLQNKRWALRIFLSFHLDVSAWSCASFIHSSLLNVATRCMFKRWLQSSVAHCHLTECADLYLCPNFKLSHDFNDFYTQEKCKLCSCVLSFSHLLCRFQAPWR